MSGGAPLHWENLFKTGKDDRPDYTLPKTNSQRTPENGLGLPPKREQRLSSNHPFSGAMLYMLVSGSRVIQTSNNFDQLRDLNKKKSELGNSL